MYKLIIRKWNKETEKYENDFSVLPLILAARWHYGKKGTMSVTVVDRTGFVYLHESRQEGAKNQAFRMSEA